MKKLCANLLVALYGSREVSCQLRKKILSSSV